MSAAYPAKLLWDARRAAERVQRFATGKTYADYVSDDMLRAAVERQFEIIGEAFTALRRLDPALAAGIVELPRIVAFRNILIHSYATVNDRIVWDVVETDLAKLLDQLNSLLAGMPQP